ncbi:Hpt domain-containing protein [bacterium]|nr:Hpt domain-containing protein [bacterium]
MCEENVLNLEALQDMADGDKEYECEIIQDIMDEAATIFVALRELHSKNDPQEFGELVHRFKGCLSYVSSQTVIASYQRIENMSRREKTMPSMQEIDSLENTYFQLKDKLDLYVKSIL